MKQRKWKRNIYSKTTIAAIALVFTGITIGHTSISFASTALSDTPELIVSTIVPIQTEDGEIVDEVTEEVRRQEALGETIAQDIEERKRQEELAAMEEYINSIVCDPTDVSRVSGLKEDDYKYLTKGTWWSGNEQALIDLEKNYGINAMFAMSVSTLESYYGKSDRANSRNNYYGIELPTTWSSLYDCTQYWGGMLNRMYTNQGYISVWAIGPRYCPPNREWEVFMNDNMKSLYDSLITNLRDTIE